MPEEEVIVKKNLSQLTDQVVVLRKHASEIQEEVNKYRADYESEHAAVLTYQKKVEQELVMAEQELRNRAVETYKETGERKPGPGIEVKLYDVLTYDQAQAFEWAKEHKQALQLNKSVFDKIVKADTPDFVSITKEPRATIAEDLEKALAGEVK